MSQTIREHLRLSTERLGSAAEQPLLDAQVLLAHALEKDRSWLYAHADDPLPATAQAVFEQLIEQRAAGHPVAHLTGRRAFWAIELEVSADTLIPRPETELLVETVLQANLPEEATVLDLGTGSGAIALAIAYERSRWQITAVDRSVAALDVARRNLERLQLKNVSLLHGDWFDALPAGSRFDAIVSNPPYIAERDPHLTRGDLRFEPRDALVSGADGLDDIRHLVAHAATYLKPGGWLWLEHGYDQGDAVAGLLHQYAYHTVTGNRDLAGNARVSGGQRQS